MYGDRYREYECIKRAKIKFEKKQNMNKKRRQVWEIQHTYSRDWKP